MTYVSKNRIPPEKRVPNGPPPPADYDMVFVFGSNEGGYHGGGAALYALHYHGAVMGVGFGPRGRSYAIPTKNEDVKTLRVAKIQGYVDVFLEYARFHPDVKFQLTAIGCGLAGLSTRNMAKRFAKAPQNVILPPEFLPFLDYDEERFWSY